MKDNQKTVALKAEDQVQQFTADHAARLLAYPGSVWKKVEPEAAPAPVPSPAKPKRKAKPSA